MFFMRSGLVATYFLSLILSRDFAMGTNDVAASHLRDTGHWTRVSLTLFLTQ
jgi:hypothetical protein